MHPILLQALASQRAALMPMAAANGRRRRVLLGALPWMVRERIGWTLVHAGLRLIVERERA